DFFRPDREPGDFDLDRAVEDALFVMEASLRDNHIAVVKNLASGLKAYGHSNQFAQVVLNILSNAKEAIAQCKVQDGRIEISLVRCGEWGMLSIQDNGGGIPEDILAKIYDPYFTTKEQGSGIGLYMTKTIIERNLHGEVSASNRGNGALFTLSIPLSSLENA
ncbi:MAG: HAMP domain-containing sensor histidine kinase, partial [Methylococcaceae bacterium]|nr:HAMP domain-containing sensor histidine kinase [Methylococcaceae bacterium]